MKSDGWRQREIDRLRTMGRLPAEPKATASGWDDPTFGDRVIARAERYEKLITELENPLPEPVEPAQVKWDRMVAEIMEVEEVDRPAALKIARQRRPDLLERMKVEANAKAGR